MKASVMAFPSDRCPLGNSEGLRGPTLPHVPPPSAGEGGPRVSEGRERGARYPAPSLPSPDPLRGPPSPRRGGREELPQNASAGKAMVVSAPALTRPKRIAVSGSTRSM
ncbi:hypothetical protein FV232_17385 [Methylobacterium sp. WL30]|nr:hypothetical protein FV223_20960 [Methylobacterium sp. WL116]TXN38935.1 hypothetical protein FV225_11725 [Methylobacterium sp. WL93]TXN48801.1 hypothetical protein FV227_19460 [Methylobacterium sp. WL119]TXN65779.1 hypothetical protein FV232_17385 [Methylobacterium sp. WL30]